MIAIVDYGLGNILAFSNMFKRLNIEARVARHADELAGADKIVLPGVGAFDHAMELLQASGMRDMLDELVLGEKVPVLGICVGMQILFAAGVEHGVWTEGCGAWPGTVERLDAGVLPHMGWNTVSSAAGSVLFAGISADTRFYFVHSYALRSQEAGQLADAGALISWTEHGEPFAAAAEQGALSATQFHPEKSGDAGAALLTNWLEAL